MIEETEDKKFKIKSKFAPTGDQPQAIENLVQGLNDGLRTQVLMGVTGSGKTFTMANIIEKAQRPTLVIAHNKTLLCCFPARPDRRHIRPWPHQGTIPCNFRIPYGYYQR